MSDFEVGGHRRAIGDDRFLAKIERTAKRSLKPWKRGPKPQTQTDMSGK